MTINCPACQQAMREAPAHNSLSCYHKGVYICHECGVREAFEGPFWTVTARAMNAIRAAQEAWINAYVNRSTV